MRKFDGVIFDLDGTLLDSVRSWADIDREFLGSYGFSVPDDYMDAVMSLTFRETAEYTIRRFGLRDTPEAIMERWTQMAQGGLREQCSSQARCERASGSAQGGRASYRPCHRLSGRAFSPLSPTARDLCRLRCLYYHT